MSLYIKKFIYLLMLVFLFSIGWFACSHSHDENGVLHPSTTVDRQDLIETEKEIAYTITFDAQDGSLVPAKSLAQGEKLTAPTDPTKDGFGFAGWYLDQELKEKFNFEEKITSDLTLYAKWTSLWNFTTELVAHAEELAIANYSGWQTEITIPATINGQPVTSIADHAFAGNQTLQSVTLPSGLKHVGANAFAGCTSLKTIVLPNTVSELGEGAFAGCASLQNVTLSTELSQIKQETFANCRSLTSLILPDKITKIENKAFADCTSLQNIILSSELLSIGNRSFANCLSLAALTLPAKMENIEPHAFTGCSNLRLLISLNPEPPLVKIKALENVPADCLIKVPLDAVDDYQTKPVWGARENYILGLAEHGVAEIKEKIRAEITTDKKTAQEKDEAEKRKK